MKNELICPRCKNTLILETDKYACRNCGTDYPVKEGVVCFSEGSKDHNYFSAEVAEFLAEKEKNIFGIKAEKKLFLKRLKNTPARNRRI